MEPGAAAAVPRFPAASVAGLTAMLRRLLTPTDRYAEFLPDAEGLVERNHSPAAGLLILAVAAIFAGLIGWAGLTEVEQVVRAEGQVEPAGRVKLVNHPDGGRIAEIHVADGDPVSAGQPLVTFDSEIIRAELAELTGRWQVKSAEAARLRAEASGEPPLFDDELLRDRPAMARQQADLLAIRRAAHASQAETLMQTAERRTSEVESLAAELTRFRNSQGLVGKEVQAVRTLAEKGLYPRLRLVALERQMSDVVGDAKKAEARLAAAEAALGEAESRRRSLERDQQSAVLAELAAAEAERDRLAEGRKRAQALLRNMVVRAPVDGVVQELAATPGQSVGSNQPLMKLVPTGGGLVIEARVDNQDVGYIKIGQVATVKVRAFDFLRYGTLEGRIERIAADATADPASGTYPYRIIVYTDRADLGAGENRLAVVPGMVVDVDLLVGERTILSYLTDRILRLREDAFREG
jgi:adhesin transport system membrane fusion protein